MGQVGRASQWELSGGGGDEEGGEDRWSQCGDRQGKDNYMTQRKTKNNDSDSEQRTMTIIIIME